MENKKLLDQVVKCFQDKCVKVFGKRLTSLYLMGSYALGKISTQRPDINFILILDKVAPKDFLVFGEILRKTVRKFKDQVNIRPEPRPFRPIYPKRKGGFDLFLHANLLDARLQNNPDPFNVPKWFLEGMKSSRKLLYGKDILRNLSIPKITKEDIVKGVLVDLAFYQLPLERAPVQYDKNDHDLLFNEAVLAGKMAAYFGVEAMMSEEELAKKKYLKFIAEKELLPAFYAARYSVETANLVEKILDARENFKTYKNDPKKAKEIFQISLHLMNKIRAKALERTLDRSV